MTGKQRKEEMIKWIESGNTDPAYMEFWNSEIEKWKVMPEEEALRVFENVQMVRKLFEEASMPENNTETSI